MRADTQLDYSVFQLTPTRTRCELHVVAKGITYKLASGLLKPFVSHLRAVEEQLAKGGYSIRLEPPDPSKVPWFTKGTMERFVRFVSTPEVLERVSSVEVELLELEETTRQQSSDCSENNGPGEADNMGSKTASSQLTIGKPPKPVVSDKVNKEGAENGGVEESSKQRLLRALDARRMMLQKEQGMAFARALAAGFKLENMDDLLLFAETFGASRLRDACVKFVALCKKRQEAGLGLEDLELMAAESAQSDMAFMGAMGGTMWPDAVEGKLPTLEDGNEKHSRRGSLEGTIGASPTSANGHGTMEDGDGGDYLEARGPAMVKGHPVMGAWQGQPSNQFMSGIYGQNPYLPYGFAGGPVPPGHAGLPYPHYPGSPYMPVPYPDVDGWQPHSSLPPQSHPLYKQTTSTPPSAQQIPKSYGDPMHDLEEYSTEITEKFMMSARRSASPGRRRSASPMRKVQIGRHGGSKRSGMVVIRNINYIASNEQQHENKVNGRSDHSESWSEDGESEEYEEEDAVGLGESTSRDGEQRHSKREKRKASSKDAILRGGAEPNISSEGDAELTIRSQQNEGINNRDVNDQTAQDDLFSNLANRARQQSSSDATLETVELPDHGGRDIHEESGLAQYSMLLSQRDGPSRSAQPQSFDMFEQEHQDSKKMSGVDDSYIIPDSRSSSITARDTQMPMEPDYDLSSKLDCDPPVDKRLSDDSFIVLARLGAERDVGNVDWRMPLNLECEMPGDQVADVVDSAEGRGAFEPADLFMVPDRTYDSYKRAWNSPLDYDMQVLAADLIDNGQHGQEQAAEDKDEVGEPEVAEKEDDNIEIKPSKDTTPRKLSEKDAKAKAMKDMLEWRRAAAAGSRSGRPNPLAEAQLRAEKMRAYKAGLQKSKKEKEEQERKRIEDLKMQRQLRIAARSNSNGSPSSTASQRAAMTPPAATKSSPKVPKKLSNGSSLSSSLNKDRIANLSRVSRPALASPKSSESTVSRSMSSLSDGKESRKSTSVVRSSTGSQLTSHYVRHENGPVPHSNKSTNGHGRSEEKVGLPKIGRTVEKVGYTNTGSAKEKIVHMAAVTKEKLGRTEGGQANGELGRTESGRADEKLRSSESRGTMEKAQALTSYPPKTVASQYITSHNVRRENGPVPHSDKSTNGHGRSEEKVGLPKIGRTVEKVGYTNTGSAKEKIVHMAALTKEKLGRTEGGQANGELGRTESGRADEKLRSSESRGTMEKAQALTSYAPKTVASQDISMALVKSSRDLVAESKSTKKAAVAAPPKMAIQKRAVPEESVAIPNKKSDTMALPSTQTEVTEDDRLAKPMGHEELRHSPNENGYASPAPPTIIASSEEGSHASLANVIVMAEASNASLHNTTVMAEANHASFPKATVIANELLQREDAGASYQPESICDSNNGQLECDIVSSVGVKCHSQMAHISSMEDNTLDYASIDLQDKDGEVLDELLRSQLTGQYSPPFAPHTEYALGPSTNLSPMSPPDLSPEPNPTESSSIRSRKKWGDSKAKGLKRLLLLGRKSGRSSAHNAPDMPSEAEEEDSLSCNGKDMSLNLARDLDNSIEQGSPSKTDTGFGSSSSKGSRSIFSLSTFRGKSAVKV